MAKEEKEYTRQFSPRHYKENLRDVFRDVRDWNMPFSLHPIPLAITGAMGGLFLDAFRTKGQIPNLIDIEAAQRAGNEAALQVARENGITIDVATLDAMIEARTTAIAEVTTTQQQQQAEARNDVSHQGAAMATGAVGLPLLILFAMTLPGSWVRKEKEEREQNSRSGGAER